MNSKTIAEANSAYNAFALCLKYLVDCGQISANQLPKLFVNAAIESVHHWQDQNDVFQGIYQFEDTTFLQLALVPVLRSCVQKLNPKESSSKSRRWGSEIEINALAYMFRVNVCLKEDNETETNLGVASDSGDDCLGITMIKQGADWSFEAPDDYSLSVIKTMVKKSHRKQLLPFNYEKKRKDIHALVNMQKTLRNRTNSNEGIKECLQQLAKFCGGVNGLSFDDSDEQLYLVRNRYGYKMRSRGGQPNPDKTTRIDFEMLFRVKALLDDGFDFAENVSKDLVILQLKLNNIILREQEADPELFSKISLDNSVKESSIEFPDLMLLNSFVQTQYPNFIVRKLRVEGVKLAQLEIASKYDVYKLARRMVVIGELFHDYAEVFPGAKNNKNNNAFSLFDLICDSKNGFMYFDWHQVIILLMNMNNPEIQTIMAIVAQSLSQFLRNISSLSAGLIDDMAELCEVTKQALTQFHKLVLWGNNIKLLSDNKAESDDFGDVMLVHARKIESEMRFLVELEESDELDLDSIIKHICLVVTKSFCEIESYLLHGKVDQGQILYSSVMLASNKKMALTSKKNPVIYREVADNYARLGLYEFAIQYYLAALQYFIVELPDDVVNKSSQSPETEVNGLEDMSDRVILVDKFYHLFGVSVFEMQMYAKAMRCYRKIGGYDDALRFYLLLKQKIDFEQLGAYKKMLGHSYKHNGKEPVDLGKQYLENLGKFSDYNARMEKIRSTLTKIKHPYISPADDENFFVAIADFQCEFASVCMAHQKYLEAARVLSWSFDFITGKIDYYEKRNTVHITSYGSADIAKYQVKAAWCYYHVKQHEKARFFLNLPLSSSNIAIKLETQCLQYWFMRNSSDVNEQELLDHVACCRKEFEQNVQKIKRILGEDALDVAGKVHCVVVDYLIRKKDFKGMRDYLVQVLVSMPVEYGLSVDEAFPYLSLSVAKSLLSLLTPKMSEARYFTIMAQALHYYGLAKNNYFCSEVVLYDDEILFVNKVSEYITTYFDLNKRKDFIELCHLIEDGLHEDVFVREATEHLLKSYMDNPIVDDQIFAWGLRFLEFAERDFAEKDYPKAYGLVSAAHTILSKFHLSQAYGKSSVVLGQVMQEFEQPVQAIAAYENANRCFVKLGLYYLKRDVEKKLVKLRTKLYQDIAFLHNDGVKLYKNGQHDDALAKLKKGFELIASYEKVLRSVLQKSMNHNFSSLYGSLCFFLGKVYHKMDVVDDARYYFSKGLSIYERNTESHTKRIVLIKQQLKNIEMVAFNQK